MPTLSQLSSESRSLAKWGGISIGIIILLFVLFKMGAFIKDMLYPTPPEPPTAGYGKLPQIDFPKQTETKSITYSIDTVSGDLPDFPDRTNIYKMVKPQPDLLALKKAQEKLNNIEFKSSPNLVSQNIYRWSLPAPLFKTLTYNILTSDFTLTSSYLMNGDVNSGKNFPIDEMNISGIAQDYLENMESFPDDFDLERKKVDYFAIKSYVLISSTSISGAQAARVYFFQKSINKLPIFYSDPNTSPVNLLITGGESQAQVVEAKFTYQKASDESETYAIKSAVEAFEELKNGDGFIASNPVKTENVLITNVFLAYYISENKQNYLMPIVVFEGNDNFFAYISAVKDEWIDK